MVDRSYVGSTSRYAIHTQPIRGEGPQFVTWRPSGDVDGGWIMS